MAKEREAKALTTAEINALCDRLRANDLSYASTLDALQASFLSRKPKIRNFQEFKVVQDLKLAIVGLHSVPVQLQPDDAAIPQVEAEASRRLKSITEVIH